MAGLPQDDTPQLGLFLQTAAPTRRLWTVKALVSATRGALEREYTDVFVEGEVSNYRPADSGHLYFTLKDGDAQLRMVMFRSQAKLMRFKLANGLQVIARGRVTIYEPRGELQFSAEHLEPKGAGALQIAFEQLKAKLAEEGLFDAGRKKPMPAMPKRIGIVTSPRGAVIQDMLNVLRRRHESVHILVYPAQVQGESAAAEVAAGVKYFNRAKNVDVIIIARGGGSADDLACFNDEALARAVAASKLPTISAIGHETDFTIIDFVADMRAPTPSAAAELVVESKKQLADRLAHLHQRLGRGARYRLLLARNAWMEKARSRVFSRFADGLQRRQQRIDELQFRIASAEKAGLGLAARRVELAASRVRAQDVRRLFTSMRKDVASLSQRLTAFALGSVSQQRARVEQTAARLQALSPLAILERGYALVYDDRGNLLKDPAQVQSGQTIIARLARGTLEAAVKNKK